MQANPDHVEVVKKGTEAIAEWRQQSHILVALELYGVNLSRADLRMANLSGAKFREATLRKADLSAANLSKADLRKADLRNANFSAANLSGADLRKADLSAANLSDADLRNANLSDADLRVATLRGADLRGANLSDAGLIVADLSGADLSAADLSAATLRGANLRETRVAFTIFGSIDLSDVGGLETVQHRGPSTLGIDTLFRSKGKIPEVFLRGCGVPDDLITYLPSLFGAEKAIQFYSCFISYSHKDEDFANRLHSRMRDEHLQVWYAPEDMKSGQKIHEQIEQAIRIYDKLLLVLSDTSMGSEWVATEIYHARQREVKEKRQVLFPIRLVPFEAIQQWKCFDADTGKDLAREIREYFIPDFSDWKDHDCQEPLLKVIQRPTKQDNAS